MSTTIEWRIDAIEQKAQRACDSLWKLDSLGSDVDRIQNSLREFGSQIDGLRSELASANDKIEQLERALEEKGNVLGPVSPGARGAGRQPDQAGGFPPTYN